MAKQLTAYLDDGETPAATVDWPLIEAGEPSTPRAYRLRNTGTENLTGAVLSIVADPTSDADEMARIGLDPSGTADPASVPLGTSPLALGAMTPLAERRVVVNRVIPAGTSASSGLRRVRFQVRETLT